MQIGCTPSAGSWWRKDPEFSPRYLKKTKIRNTKRKFQST